MKKEPREFSRWFDKKIEEGEERRGIIKIKATDVIATVITVLLIALWLSMNPSAISSVIIILIPITMIQLSASQRTIVSQEKRIRELEKITQNQRLDPIVKTPVDEVEAQGTQGHP